MKHKTDMQKANIVISNCFHVIMAIEVPFFQYFSLRNEGFKKCHVQHYFPKIKLAMS